jgi:hypothetical protein
VAVDQIAIERYAPLAAMWLVPTPVSRRDFVAKLAASKRAARKRGKRMAGSCGKSRLRNSTALRLSAEP